MRTSILFGIVLVCTPPLRARQGPPAIHIDASSLTTFVDNFLQSEMAKRHIPGAVFAVVSEGRVLFARGFGSAELEAGLTKDVNEYLKSFQLPPYRDTPVTLHHLLTHTAGFEERLIGIACKEATKRQSLASCLAQSMPPRFARPGEVLSYSNHGMNASKD